MDKINLKNRRMSHTQQVQSYQKFLADRYSDISEYAKDLQVVHSEYFMEPEKINHVNPQYLQGLVQKPEKEIDVVDLLENEVFQMMENMYSNHLII